ncbi:unnamed protein product [Dibothriocephalus latus]|uniref:Uncharacterized protein n=1 Tax=Dibothriocephalus latus TaxID=60516 RepID=A0A3P7PBY5_DIBLA|nr:unnamed protein product [Dibothriocephalus latus]
MATLLKSLQRPMASLTAAASVSSSSSQPAVSTSPAVSATPATTTAAASSQAEDPFTIISRLTGLSNLIQR